MPNSVVVTLAEQADKPILVVENIWRKAKRFATNEGQKGNYLRVLEITKRILGLTEAAKVVTIGQRVSWHGVVGTVVETLPDSCTIKPEIRPSVESLLRQNPACVAAPLLEIELL